jgi:hypothetical protein
MENTNNTFLNVLDLSVVNLNNSSLLHSKRLELFARWVPICQEIAEESNVEVPDADRLRLMILSAHQAMCLLAQSALTFPDRITQDRIINQFLIDCFTSSDEALV